MKILIPYIWLFLSGFIALTLEILWVKYFQVLLGNTIQSFSWVTGIFLLGISLGAYIGERFIKGQKSNYLRIYLFTELLITLGMALSFLFLVNPSKNLYSFISPKSLLTDGLIAIIFIMPITTLMGIGLPILTEQFKKTHTIEKLYALNTIGGGLGVLILGFFGVMIVGYQNLIFIVIALNLLLSLSIYYFSDRLTQHTQDQNLQLINHEKIPSTKILTLAFFCGFILLGLEVVWFKSLELILNDRAYISTLVLFIVLVTLGITSYLAPKLEKWSPSIFPILILLGVSSLLVGEFISEEAFLIARDFPRFTIIKIAYLALIFLIPLASFSFIFPKLLISKRWSGEAVAKIFISNTVGGLVGTLSVSYFFINTLGMKSFYLITVFFLIGIIYFLPNIKMKKTYASITLALFILFSVLLNTNIFIHKPQNIKVTKESPIGLFSLIENNRGDLEMYNGNYRIVSPYKNTNVAHAQMGLAFFPALFHNDPKIILSMGTGYGISLGAFLNLNPEKLYSVEIHSMVNQVSHYFKDKNREWYNDIKVVKSIDDARGFLARSNKKYDLISSNIASPYTTAGSQFLTKEYFTIVRNHLKNKGIYSQLIWGPHLVEIIHTFKSVFPHLLAIPGYSSKDLIILGSLEPFELVKPLDYFGENWPLYQGKFTIAETIKIGDAILEEKLLQKPEFLISDHFAYLTHNFTRGLNFFWIHK